METQATVSTANTGSLTPQEGSSSAEGGRAVGEGGIRAPPPVEPLTRASAECCSPQASFEGVSRRVYFALVIYNACFVCCYWLYVGDFDDVGDIVGRGCCWLLEYLLYNC